MYSDKTLVILDADGTTVDAFKAIATTFAEHDMNIGDLHRFQKRHNLFKYLGGVKEFPKNLRMHLTKVEQSKLIGTLTEVYREQCRLYEGMRDTIQRLIEQPDILVGVVTRNITNDPVETLTRLYERESVDVNAMDFLVHVPLREKKTDAFRAIRQKHRVNPAKCFVCGDENKDYVAAISTGMHPMIASYGFESFERLIEKYEIPTELISMTPDSLSDRLFNALSLDR